MFDITKLPSKKIQKKLTVQQYMDALTKRKSIVFQVLPDFLIVNAMDNKLSTSPSLKLILEHGKSSEKKIV